MIVVMELTVNNFFVSISSTVKNNLRVCFVASGGGTTFQQRCRDYVNFAKSVNIIWFPHWTKRQLLACATHHLRSNNTCMLPVGKCNTVVTVVAITTII